MRLRFYARCTAAMLVLFVSSHSMAQTTPHFVPDWTFQGSELSDWHTLGAAGWSADHGVITSSTNGQAGWLVLNRSYQDAQFYLRFRCASDCDAGVLLRMDETAGGNEGVLVAFEDSLRLYRVSLDNNGLETGREKLGGAASMIRIAPAAAESPVQMSSSAVIMEGEWNELHIAIDANIVRVHLNGWGFGASSGITADEAGGYGPIALYAGGSGAVEFDQISALNYNERHITPEAISDDFAMQRLDEFYYAWDTAVADINQDGTQDVVAGPYYYLGPDYTTRREIYLGETYNPSTDYTLNMITHAADFTGDGWPDVLATEMRPMVLYVNPQGENRRWDRYEVMPEVISESTILHDMDGDGQPEIVHAHGQGVIAYAEPDPSNPTAPWIVHNISDPMGFGTVIHGLGAGDVNGDGRADILIRSGWFEQPASPRADGKWIYHEFPFNEAGSLVGHGGGPMSVVDLNGDGLNDVATSLNAHGWGLAWFEQKRSASGEISFNPHLIMGDMTSDNADDVAFSQLHGGVETADIDGDGTIDLITGKRYWAHLDSSSDPNPYGEAVLYWYKTVKNAQAPGGISFEPQLIHNRSGVGSQFEVEDVNGDGLVDIVTSADRGTFIFWGK